MLLVNTHRSVGKNGFGHLNAGKKTFTPGEFKGIRQLERGAAGMINGVQVGFHDQWRMNSRLLIEMRRACTERCWYSVKNNQCNNYNNLFYTFYTYICAKVSKELC